MAFVSLAGDGSSRPTFFELVAAERLMPSLKAAVIYTLSVCAQTRPVFHRLLDYEDELFALITWWVNRASLFNSGASFAESLYGLRRAPHAAPSPGAAKQALDRRQRLLCQLVLVGIPYMKVKLERAYLQHGPRVDPLLGRLNQQQSNTPDDGTLRGRLVQRLRRQLWLYPWAHAAAEGLKLAYQMRYLLESTPYYSPLLHLLGLHMVRVSGQEMVEVGRRQRQHRQQRLAAARGARWVVLRWLREGRLRASFALADHTRNALILSVFAFKVLEWWYNSAEEKLSNGKVLPPPPPPKAPKPAPDGLPLPADTSLCPLCRELRTNPAMAVVSGYVFCYPCIFRHVEQHASCPVTRFPCGVDQIRRLYQNS